MLFFPIRDYIGILVMDFEGIFEITFFLFNVNPALCALKTLMTLMTLTALTALMTLMTLSTLTNSDSSDDFN